METGTLFILQHDSQIINLKLRGQPENRLGPVMIKIETKKLNSINKLNQPKQKTNDESKQGN